MSPYSGLGMPHPDDIQASADRVRQQGFSRGFDAGGQDACSLIREEVAPQIKSAGDAFAEWNAMMLRFEENSTHQILRMADTIAAKILGAPPKSSAGGLDSLMSELREHMRNAYKIEFKLNPEDMDALLALMACADPQWGQWDYISLNSDAGVQRGSLQVQPGAQTILVDDGVLRSLEVLLSKVSTK